jgi:LmbE family N-acetylglucosaminyl deacetylase
MPFGHSSRTYLQTVRKNMANKPLRLLILGAHPDDAEYHAGGLASIYRMLGHTVKMVSVTDGGAGHQTLPRQQLATRRRKEAAAAARLIGAKSVTWDYADGELVPSLELRNDIIREVRTFSPDLVLTHRTFDYHPDHRAVGQAVQDASYMVTVPKIVPEVPILRRDPVVAYMVDLFTRPCPLRPDLLIDVDDHVETIVAMLACHESQVFDFLPYNQGISEQVPADQRQRMAWLRTWYAHLVGPRADRFRDQLIRVYGEPRGRKVQFAEAYEISEYASPLDSAERQRLFPFVPTSE